MLGERTKDNSHKLEQGKFSLDIILKNSHDSGQILEHIVQRGCGVSVTGEIQNAPGHSPEQPPPAEHALKRRLDRRPPGFPSNLCSSIIINSDDQQNTSM